MNALAPGQPAAPDLDVGAARSERTERRLRMLGELAEIGMALARAVGQRALREAEAAPSLPEPTPPERPAIEPEGPAATPPAMPRGVDWGLAFSRIARTVRQTIALEARLETDRFASHAAADRKPVEARRPSVPTDPRRADIRRLAREFAAGEPASKDVENLADEIDERLDDPWTSAALDRGVSVQAIALSICRELGIVVDLKRHSDEVLGFGRSGAASMRPGSGRDPP